MSVTFSKPRNPAAIPEHTLWTLRKDVRRVEARTRMTPVGPELRICVDGELLWSQVLPDGRAVGELAAEQRRALEGRGWVAEDGAGG